MIPYFTANQGKQLEEKVKTVEGVGSRVTALEEKLVNTSRDDDGLVVDESIKVTGGNIEVSNGGVINLNGAVIGVEDVDGIMRVGQFIITEEEEVFNKFGYVEEVECNINPAVETIVQDALYDKSYDIASLNIPSTVTILEVFVAEDSAWYQPSRSSSNADDVYDYVHFFATDSADDVAITKIKILR